MFSQDAEVGVKCMLNLGCLASVVTEFGVAQLRGKSARQRALEMIGIAHPKFRDELTEQRKRLKLISSASRAGHGFTDAVAWY